MEGSWYTASMVGKRARCWVRQLTRPALFIPTLAALALVAGWFVVSQVILNPERLRSDAETYITQRTGLPASIEQVSVHLLPTPSLRLSGIRIGEPGFEAHADTVIALFRLERLGEGVLDIPQVSVAGARVSVHDSPERQHRWDELRETFRQTARAPEDARLTFVVGEIAAEQAEFHFEHAETVVIRGDLHIEDALGAQRRVRITQGRVPYFGSRARFALNANIEADTRTRRIRNVYGNAETYGFAVVPEQWADLGPLHADLRIAFEGDARGPIAMRVHGDLRPPPRRFGASPFAGIVSGQAWWKDGELIVNDFEWRSRHMRAEFDGERRRDGSWVVAAPELAADAPVLAALGDLFIPRDAVSQPDEDAWLTIEEGLVEYSREGGVQWIGGRAEFAGFNVAVAEGEQAFEGLKGSVSVDNNVFTLENIEGDGVLLSGEVAYDAATASAATMLSGHVDLTPARLAPYVATDAITALSGRLNVTRFSGTFAPGHGTPPDLRIEGEWTDGGMELALADNRERFTDIHASFSSDGERISTDVSGNGQAVGAVRIEGLYDAGTRRWRGQCEADLLAIADAFRPEAVESEWLRPAISHWSNGELALDLVLPAEDRDGLEFKVAHSASATSQLTARMERQEGRLTFTALDGNGALPARLWRGQMPEGWAIDGAIEVDISAAPGRNHLEAGVNLDGVTIDQGRWFNKPAGVAANVRIDGQTDGGWRMERGEAAFLGERVEFFWDGDAGVHAPQQAISLHRLSEVMPVLVETAGVASIAMEPSPPVIMVELADGGAHGDDGSAFSPVDGVIRWEEGRLTLDDVRVQGHESDLVLSLHFEDGHVSGGIGGRQANADALTEAWEQFQHTPDSDASARQAEVAEAAAPQRVTADIAVDLDRLLFRRAALDQVSATLTADSDSIAVSDFECRPYSGRLAAQAEWPRVTGLRVADMELEFDSVHARLFDDLLFSEPRGFRGSVSGNMTFEIPFGGDEKPVEGTSGSGRLRARDGSFGRLGLATRILAILRTTEVFRLRVPNLRDEGLLYEEFNGRFNMTDGIVHITEASLRSPSLMMEAGGYADLHRDMLDLGIKAYPLESVTGLVDQVPIVGDLMSEIRKQGGLYLRASGATHDPRVRIVSAGVLESIFDSLSLPRW